MTIRNKFSLIAVTALLISIAVIFFTRKNDHQGEKFVYAVPFKTELGWGYKIYLGKDDIKDTTNDKIFIQQDYIPGITGRKAFVSEDDARRVAGLVIRKIGSGTLPTITSAELDSLGIDIK